MATQYQYRTVSGDTLAKICYDYYGSCSAVPTVLNANPGLAEYGTVYESGIMITLPDYDDDDSDEDVLWS
jgi:phage tail protein X